MHSKRLEKLKSALSVQKKKLEEYLVIMNLEKEALLADKIMKASLYLHHEREIITTVNAFQKVIPPLEKEIGEILIKKSSEISTLKRTLEDLKSEIREGIATNHSILEVKKAGVEKELKAMRKNTSFRASGYGKATRSSLIDISR